MVFKVIKSWGVTGILLEWEDTFPYMGELVEIGSVKNAGGDNLYSLAEVKHLLAFIKELGMEPIQLVQTFGHMEFVLKHPAFRDLREIEQAPAVMCPTKLRSLQLVMAMVDQALEVLSPAARYVSNHEAWLSHMKENEQVNFIGIILTGWSR
ncbi:hypothetical protein HF086_003376 [Spodoptera exigua]|uniref:Beta-N-acetylhexosaminidase n=1 Tax=Spodoptera exigua TaxID=7107 RepID=A0A922MZK9_SPOEX|nr:hypothetical protein HF086_003376 [Spodoptera exigua]